MIVIIDSSVQLVYNSRQIIIKLKWLIIRFKNKSKANQFTTINLTTKKNILTIKEPLNKAETLNKTKNQILSILNLIKSFLLTVFIQSFKLLNKQTTCNVRNLNFVNYKVSLKQRIIFENKNRIQGQQLTQTKITMKSSMPNFHELKCTQHSNPIERICLKNQCQDKILCLLCETHLHGKQFLSILDKPTQSYKRFCQTISQQIDFYLLQLKSNQDQIIRHKQKQLLNLYYKQLKNRIELFLDERMKQIVTMLQSEKYKTIESLKNARIAKDFIHLDQNLWKICFRAYQGQKISQILQNNEVMKSQQVYNRVDQLHQDLRKVMEKFGFNMKIRVPQIRNKNDLLDKKEDKSKNAFSNQYQMDFTEDKKFTYKLLCQTQPFDSIISSSLKTINEQIMTVSYDKKLRVHKRNNRITPDFDLLFEKQYTNILTKINKIGQDLYAIGQSKQLLIQKIQQQKKGEWKCQNIMKLLGHQERIIDISTYNTRIIGSASHQGTKIWDLYKQKCQFTFKQTYNPSALIFLPKINNLAIGYNNHITKLYSIQKLKTIRKYELPGLPLVFSQQKLNQNTFYVGGFSSHLAVLDVRLNKLAFSYNFQQDALTSLSQMLFQENKMLLGFRNGGVKIFDLQMRKVKMQLSAQSSSSHLSKPNGIVGVYEQGQKQIVTVGCNQKKLKLWQISNNLNNIY